METRSTVFLDHTDGDETNISRSFSHNPFITFDKVVSSKEQTLTPLEADTAINFCDITVAKIIFLETLTTDPLGNFLPFDYKLDSNTNTATRVSRVAFLIADATAIFLSNPSGTDNVVVKITLIGV